MKLLKRDVLKATGSLQLCAGQDVDSEAAIHVIYEILNKESTDAVLMICASNAFNEINREAFLRNTKTLSPSISTYISNCYSSQTGLYIQRWAIHKIRRGSNTR